MLNEIPSSSRDLEKNRPGRPCKNIVECSDKTKKRKIKYLLETQSPEEIATANESILHKQGKRDSAGVVN